MKRSEVRWSEVKKRDRKKRKQRRRKERGLEAVDKVHILLRKSMKREDQVG